MSFEPSEYSYGDSEPGAPGSDSAAYDVASFYLSRAAHKTSSYATEAKLLLAAAKAKALSTATPSLLYGHEVAILQTAATEIGTADPSSMSKLLALSGGVVTARAAAQASNPVYVAQTTQEKAKSWWDSASGYVPVIALAVFGGGALFSRRGKGRQNPDALWDIGRDEFRESFRELDTGFRDLESGDVRGAIKRSLVRAPRRVLHLDSAQRLAKLFGLY